MVLLRRASCTGRTPDTVLFLYLIGDVLRGEFLCAGTYRPRRRFQMLQICHVVREIINARGIFPLCRLLEDNRRIECREIRLHLHRVCGRER